MKYICIKEYWDNVGDIVEFDIDFDESVNYTIFNMDSVNYEIFNNCYIPYLPIERDIKFNKIK